MTGHDPEIEELRDKVHCAAVLERTPPPWKLDRNESTKLSLKYRRGKGEILIVSHAGRGWWDPTSDAKGDVFGLVPLHRGFDGFKVNGGLGGPRARPESQCCARRPGSAL
jgi:hypothetical protein